MNASEEIRQLFCSRVRMVRQARGMTATELAARTGLTQYTVLSRERGERNVHIGEAALICTALGVSLLDMIDPAEFDMQRVLGPAS